jgi:hypothetical protein
MSNILPAVIFFVAAGLTLITAVVDLIVIQQRGRSQQASSGRAGILTYATDLLLPLLLQLAVAGLALLLALTQPSTVNTLFTYLLSGSVIALVGVSAGVGRSNAQRERQGLVRSSPPVLALPPPTPNGVHRCVVLPTAGERVARVMSFVLSVAFALDLPFFFLDQGNNGLPGPISDFSGKVLAVFGVLGVGLLLVNLATLDQRRILIADGRTLRTRLGLIRRRWVWPQVRQLFVRDHGDGRWSYQILDDNSRGFMWYDQPADNPSSVSTSQMAALISYLSRQTPVYLNPQQTNQRTRQQAQAAAEKISNRLVK